ncbi:MULTISPECIES: preprotein translocase subunit SecG [unclassified Variovorax]|uniref:preprotein translocase subunit SecG n=1 Tax=unclassified Variovorax TaxID=663243 RepID=UPI00076D2677|nr:MULTISPECIES: preprotein translocase subunit SecG [unclassified Variovorax]KWT88160.1 Preprotein translocase subunit SecG [Variovorax sp. WDL1]PNG51992.1 Protein-export membrane protein SecG [Variovorax sp. B4]PNG54532.1 Protein-export membrane protein SecG [Variovorax sp. B2]VTV15498.1 Preprotein translocase band 1 subunit [Variovorax sp. WDL1]
MNVVLNILVGVQMLTALAMIGLILIQHGKGADMGAAFGSGSAGSLFGASGSANFLSRTTGVLAAVFFACTLLLAYFSHARPTGGGSLLERAAIGTPAPAPASAASGAASQIPSGNAPAAPPAGATAPAAPASGAAQIPTK